MNTENTIICLMGPTASGKTDLAIALTQHFPCEIISVDSAMVYRGMDIGTAKPTQAELEKAPHHLINICDPEEAYSAGRFREDALELIEAILARGHLPLLVGGTMLYFHILQNGVASLPTADKTIRDALLKEAQELGWPHMHNQLKTIDPDMAAQLHPNDTQRIQRALEVYRISGQTMTELQSLQTANTLNYDVINLALLSNDRSHLHQRIAMRFHKMIESGLIAEVKNLRKNPKLHTELPSMRTVGYRQVCQHLDGQYDYDEMIDRGIIATRQLAKRQMTWLRRWPDLKSFDCEDKTLHQQVITYLEQKLA